MSDDDNKYLDPKFNPMIIVDELDPCGVLPKEKDEAPDPDALVPFPVPDPDDVEARARAALAVNPQICTAFGEYLTMQDGGVVVNEGTKTIDLRMADPETLARVKEAIGAGGK